jgi:pimeloyl-ACP methyl ester carboxylesterase
LKALIDLLNTKKVSIIGSSSGGSVAVDFALQYPELVKALILVAPSINGYRYPLRVMLEAMKNITLLKSKGFEAAIEKFINNPFWEYFFPPQQRQEAREKVLQIVKTQKNFYGWDFKLAIPQKPYANKRLREIHVPTLIVLSDKDKVFNIKVGEYVYKNIQNSRKVVISDCGHLPFIEKPEEFNRKALDFLKECYT